ncbi:MAG TPA: cysteine--tRNA ligase [Ignavibacteriaceae bacterium]|nr:cysteine--tRNA ligase [Ignavibacteriaceae bacterium]
MLHIYNTLTKKKEEFIPLDPPNVKMYMCGPTVYDYFHIGNARSFIMADILRRYLIYKGFNVTFAMNLTDIDDKNIKKSIEEKIDTIAITQKYINAFMEDVGKLKIKRADIYPKATEHIDDIIKMIRTLEDKGLAYNKNGNVFFNVRKYEQYGKLSGKNLDELESGARIEVNEEKENPLDFSLWKKAKEGEPFWESPWGGGRPGWHIECSAMSCKHFGDTFDIHAGGNDLIFPHHENEIAQSEGANSKPFVKYWVHFGFLNINDEKMSKSLGNFFTAREVLNRYSAEVIRMFFAQAYYRGPLNFNDDLLTAAEKGLEKINNLVFKIINELENPKQGTNPDFNIEPYIQNFEKAMDDDFNTSQAVAVIFDFARDVNRILAENKNIDSSFFLAVKEFLSLTAEEVLGILSFDTEQISSSVEKELIELLISIRTDAKKQKNFSLADKIRDDLKTLGVVLEDSKDSTTFKKLK